MGMALLCHHFQHPNQQEARPRAVAVREAAEEAAGGRGHAPAVHTPAHVVFDGVEICQASRKFGEILD